jgi:stage III sporulation protein AB
MIKAIGYIIIIISSSGLGYLLGTRFNMRVRELKMLKMSLQMLETEIVYTNTPLPDAFDNISSKSSYPVKELFKCMSENLKSRKYGSASEAFEMSINENKGRISLNNEDIDILKTFAQSIGNSDVEGQVKSFKMVLKQLDAQELKAEENRAKNEKMYKNLGFLTGVTIVILLL